MIYVHLQRMLILSSSMFFIKIIWYSMDTKILIRYRSNWYFLFGLKYWTMPRLIWFCIFYKGKGLIILGTTSNCIYKSALYRNYLIVFFKKVEQLAMKTIPFLFLCKLQSALVKSFKVCHRHLTVPPPRIVFFLFLKVSPSSYEN